MQPRENALTPIEAAPYSGTEPWRAVKPDISLASHVRVGDEVLFRDLGEDMVLLDLRSGVYFSLNAVGARIWHILQEQGPLQGVLDSLVGEYDVSEGQCATDLCDLIALMRDKGLVEVSDPAAA